MRRDKTDSSTMEVYVDDILVKSKEAVDHISHLEKCFSIVRKYGMKLNPEKCTFGVRGGKFLGYMVIQRGIEANPDKIKAIMDLPHPEKLRDVQWLKRICHFSRYSGKRRTLNVIKSVERPSKN